MFGGKPEHKFELKSVLPKGLYMYGDVGSGKTFMMDMFYHESPIKHKRRVHFHSFMMDVNHSMFNFFWFLINF